MADAQFKFYEEGEVEEILQRAVKSAPSSGAMSRERLMATAAELGIPESAVVEAERELAEERRDVEFRSRYRNQRRRQFFQSAGTYAGVILLLAYISHLHSWFYWVAVIWGLNVLQEARFAFYFKGAEAEHRYQRWRRKFDAPPHPVAELPEAQQWLEPILDEAARQHPDEKIAQIKYVREQTGLGLKEAKEAVERTI